MDKKKLGLLIGILRKEKYKESRNSQWLQMNFCERICSKSTLSRLEAGLIVSYEDVYIQLSNKLSLGYVASELIEDTLAQLESTLLHQVNEGLDADVILTLKKIQRLLSLSPNLIYYQQMYELLGNVLSYYTHYEFHLSYSMQASIDMLEVFTPEISNVIRMYLYLYLQNTQEDEVFDYYCERLELHNSTVLVIRICYFHYLFVRKSEYALDLFEELWGCCNQRRRKEIQSILRLYEKHYQKKLDNRFIGYLDVDIQTNTLMSDLNEGEYYLAISDVAAFNIIYERLLKEKAKLPYYAIVRYLGQNNDREDVQFHLDAQRYIGRESHDYFVKYLYLVDPFEKREYIMNVLYDKLRYSSRLYVDFFTDEIFKLCKITKYYKDLHRMIELSEAMNVKE